LKTLNRSSLLLLIPLLSFSAIPAIDTPAKQEQLEQSRAQEAERRWYAEGNKRMVSPHGDIADRWRTKSRDNNYTARIHVVV